MHVDVDQRGIDLDVQYGERKLSVSEERLVPPLYGDVQESALDPATVHEERLGAAIALRRTGLSNVPRNRRPRGFPRDGDEFRERVLSVYGCNGLFEQSVACGLEDESPLEGKFEPDVRPSKRHIGHVLCDVAALGPVGFQKLVAGRRVVEKVPHAHLSTDRRSPRRGVLHIPLHFEADPRFRFSRPADELHARHRSNAGKGLAPKTERPYGGQIFGSENLAGRVAFKCERGVFGAHASPVVRDADHFSARAGDVDANGARACVDRILDELLDDGRGPLDHLARRDLIADVG